MLDEFIKDTLHAEIVGIVSSTLTVSCCKTLIPFNHNQKTNTFQICKKWLIYPLFFVLGEPIETQRRDKTFKMAG